jgi:glycosyltransferase involved in cell wall biosynthesis
MEAIDSVLSSSVLPYEIRIIDDGSSDGSFELLKHVHNERLRIFVSGRENKGAHATINEAARESDCKYVSILNSDDRYHPLRIEKLMAEIETKNLDGVFSRVRFISAEGKIAEKEPWYEGAVEFMNKDVPLWLSIFRRNAFMTTSNLIVDREKLLKQGGFGAYRYCHDLDFIMRACGNDLKLGFVDASLCDYRFHPTNTIKENAEKLAVEEAFIFADFITTFHPQISPEHTAILFNILTEKKITGLTSSLIEFCRKFTATFDYHSVYQDRNFNEALQRGKTITLQNASELQGILSTPISSRIREIA